MGLGLGLRLGLGVGLGLGSGLPAVQLGYFGIGQPNLEAEIEDAVTVPVTRVPISDGGGALLVFAWPGLELGLG